MKKEEEEETIDLVSFVRKPSKQGDDYFFKIPRIYMRNDFIDYEKTYKVYIKEIKEED